MPVVVSMLNSYSGWAAAAAGFMLSNDLLIVTGRARRQQRRDPELHHVPAMNRSHLNVVFGGFGAAPAAGAKGEKAEQAGTVHEATAEQVADLLAAAKQRHRRAGLRHGRRAGAAPGARS